jgi:hypothetical protein
MRDQRSVAAGATDTETWRLNARAELTQMHAFSHKRAILKNASPA